jgi:hypothetical protein
MAPALFPLPGSLPTAFDPLSACVLHDVSAEAQSSALYARIQASSATSLRQIAAALNARRITTSRDGTWSAVQVQRVMGRLM